MAAVRRAPKTALGLLGLGLLLPHPGLASRPLIMVLLRPVWRPIDLPLGRDAPARQTLAAAVLLLWPAVLLGLPRLLVLPLRAPKAVILMPPKAAVAWPRCPVLLRALLIWQVPRAVLPRLPVLPSRLLTRACTALMPKAAGVSVLPGSALLTCPWSTIGRCWLPVLPIGPCTPPHPSA